MSSRLEASPSPLIRATPGAFPTAPNESEQNSPAITLTQSSLSQAVYERRAEYTRTYRTRVKVGTWNVASLSGTEKDVGGWFVDGKGVSEALTGLSIDDEDEAARDVEGIGQQEARRTKKASTIPKNDSKSLPGGDEIGIYALGLQEIVDISSATEALRPYIDPFPARKWKRAVAKALPEGYQCVAEQQLIGLFLVIYASPLIAPTISSVSTTSVGTGLLGYMGNKGAVAARIVLGDVSRLVFVNCHLTAGTEKGSVERRNWDVAEILKRAKFDPVNHGGVGAEDSSEGIGNEDFAFWFGDLNYRLTSIPGDDVRRLLLLHTQKQYPPGQASEKKIESAILRATSLKAVRDGEFDNLSEDDRSSSSTNADRSSGYSVATSMTHPDQLDPASDPTSLQTTISSLIPHDQLHDQMRTGKAFHDGWREGPITFLPTYKYDVGSVGLFDSSEKRRGPSWCDRILYRTQKDRLDYLKEAQERQETKRRDEEMQARRIGTSLEEDETVLFDYDPETDGAQDDYYEESAGDLESEAITPVSGLKARLELDYYTSHQRVLSSDHKPLDAVFTLTYDAVNLQLKAQIQQEIARELDKAENECRPTVTVVINHDHHTDDRSASDSGSPQIEGIDFGHVSYDREKTRSITVANTGRVPAVVRFVDRSTEVGQSGAVAPFWLRIRFNPASHEVDTNSSLTKDYVLEPGDVTDIELTIHVRDLTQVRQLNAGLDKLEDVLVLRVHDGRDYFLPVRAAWLPSAFTRSVDELTRMPTGGARQLDLRPSEMGHDHTGVKWSAPQEFFRLTEAIEQLLERAVAEWEMKAGDDRPPWEVAGWPFIAASVDEAEEKSKLKDCVREALDTDQDFAVLFPPEPGALDRLEAIAETLLAFVRSMEDGVITPVLWAQIEHGMMEREKARRVSTTNEDERASILDILSSAPAHRIAFTFITVMLVHVAAELASGRERESPPESRRSSVGKSTAEPAADVPRRELNRRFAAVFADALVRTAPTLGDSSKDRKASDARKKKLLELFLASGDGYGDA